MIDLCVLRRSRELRELTNPVWKPNNQNIAEAVTKKNTKKELDLLSETNKVNVDAKSWFERQTLSTRNCSEKSVKLTKNLCDYGPYEESQNPKR